MQDVDVLVEGVVGTLAVPVVGHCLATHVRGGARNYGHWPGEQVLPDLLKEREH